MPSKEVYDKLFKQGYRVDLHPYEKYDSLASEEDLIALFEVLLKYKDRNGNHPIITANCVVANPDFNKIKESDFQEYYFEPFTETLKRYNYESSFKLLEQGLNENIFIPQFHGREHLNVAVWMNALQNNDEDILLAFKYGMIGIFPKNNHFKGNQIMVALNDAGFEKTAQLDLIIKDGLNLFERIFGFRSMTFMAPCYTWRPELEKTLMEYGVYGFQGALQQIVPNNKNITHWMGSKNVYGQYYFIRNCSFEPTTDASSNIKKCIYEIQTAFLWKKPAIISSHRINYIGSIHRENRENNLTQLNLLLAEIIKRWPDVEFISSDRLLEIIKGRD
ncbi:MAG: hypothetical protein MUO72_10060 [Bacteroidales bacterium]|nr:hypothetical protein [Bacteroidales bacterium]